MKQSLKLVFTKGNEKKYPANSADLRRKKSAIISEIYGNYFQMKNRIQLFALIIIISNVFDSCKEQHKADINNDGGLSIILEASVADIIRLNVADKNDTLINNALINAAKNKRTSEKSFAEIFVSEFYKKDSNNTLVPHCNLIGLKEKESSADCLKYIQQKTNETTENLKQILTKRVINFGIENPVIQCVGGEGRILVQLPGVKPDIRLHKLLKASANLEFWETYDNKDIFPLLDRMNKELKNILTEKKSDSGNTKSIKVVKVDSTTSLTEQLKQGKSSETDSLKIRKTENPLFIIFTPSIRHNEQGQSILSDGPVVGYALITDTSEINAFFRIPRIKSIFKPYTKFLWTFNSISRDKTILELVAINGGIGQGEPALSGNIITEAHKVSDKKNSEHPEISMTMNYDAAKIWKRLTKYNLGKSIAIVSDDRVYSYPTVLSEIAGGTTSITGRFTQEDVDDFVNLLSAGKLPVQLTIVQEKIVAPLGNH